MQYRTLTVILFLIFLISVGYSDTYVSGEITTNETWTKENGPYHVTEDLIIQSGATLSIQAGTEVIFYYYYYNNYPQNCDLGVYGRLEIYGTLSEPVIFRNGPDNGGHTFRIHFEESSSADISFWHVNQADYIEIKSDDVLISYAQFNNFTDAYNPSGLQIYNSSPTIEFSSISGAGYGFYISNSSPTIAADTLKNLGLSPIAIFGYSSPIIKNCYIKASGSNSPIEGTSKNSIPILIKNKIISESQADFYMKVGLNAATQELMTNTFSGKSNGIIYFYGDETKKNHLKLEAIDNIDYFEISGPVTINKGDTLEINNVTLRLNDDFNVNGVLFVGGELLGNRDQTGYFDWGNITISTGAEVQIISSYIESCGRFNIYSNDVYIYNSEIAHFGGFYIENCSPELNTLTVHDIYSYYEALFLQSSKAKIIDCNIYDVHDQEAIYLIDSSPEINDCEFSINSSRPVIYASYGTNASYPSLINNTIKNTGSADYLIEMSTNNLNNLNTDNYFEANGTKKILLYGEASNSNLSLPDLVDQYDVKYDWTISSGDTLFLDPGVKIGFTASSYDLIINGYLKSIGTDKSPVTLTSSTSSSSPGAWAGVAIFAGGGAELKYTNISLASTALYIESDNVKIEHCDFKNNSNYGIRLNGSSANPTIKYCTISGNNAYGIYVQNGNPKIYANKIENNKNYGVYNAQYSTKTIEARKNWWGSPSGPSGEGNGAGNAVSKGVKFNPWLASYPPSSNNSPLSFSLLQPEDQSTLPEGQIFFSWEEALDIDENDAVTYTLYLSTTSDFSSGVQYFTTENTYYLLDGFNNYQQYWWKVTANDRQGHERTSTEIFTFTVGTQNLAPEKPEIVSPESGALVSLTTPLIWTQAVDPNSFDQLTYDIQVASDENFSNLVINVQGLNPEKQKAVRLAKSTITKTLMVTLSELSGNYKLKEDEIYYWHVRAKDQKGAYSEWSDGSNFVFNKSNSAPMAPENGFTPADSIAISTLEPVLSWDAAFDPDNNAKDLKYSVQISENQYFNSITWSGESEVGKNHVKASLQKDNYQYFWRVKTVDPEGLESNWSKVLTFWVNTKLEPPLPFDLTSPGNAAEISENIITFMWENTTDPDPLETVRYELVLKNTVHQAKINAGTNNLITVNFDTLKGFENSEIEWWVLAISQTDTTESTSHFSLKYKLTGIENERNQIPKTFELKQNYPNPFNPGTYISFSLPQNEVVILQIFSSAGQKVRTLADQTLNAGKYEIFWDGTDDAGNPVASGVYLYQLRAGDFVQTRKMVLMR